MTNNTMKTSTHSSPVTSHQSRSQSLLHCSPVMHGYAHLFMMIRYRVLSIMMLTAFCVQSLFAQGVAPELLGVAQYGGVSNNGTIFKINPDGSDFRAVHKFAGDAEGRIPNGSLIQATNGSLYGMTGSTLFKIKHDGTGHTVLHIFSYPTGVITNGSLMQASNGMIYGMAYLGGFLGFGTIFRINMDGSGFSVIHHFDGINGGHPSNGSLIQGRDGSLYGMSMKGDFERGVVFKLNLDGSNYRVLHHFSSPGGAVGSLIQATNGSLYGMVMDGAIFKIETDGSGFTVLHMLQSWEGINPHGSLVQTPDGNIYGMTYNGGNYGRGTIFRIRPDGSNFAVRHHFDLTNGSHPTGDLIVHDNHLFGFTSSGGANSLGVVFKYNLAANAFSKLGDFTHETGENPWSGKLLLVYPSTTIDAPTAQASTITFNNVLAKSMTVSFIPGNGSKHLAVMKVGSPPTFQPADNVTYAGGLGSSQTVVYNGSESSFELTGLQPDKEYYVRVFSYNTNGTITKYRVASAPVASRHTRTATEKFYAMASYGGAAHDGTIFTFDPNVASPLSVIFNFRSQLRTGRHPFGQLTEAKDGALYGMNSEGILNLVNEPHDTRYGTIFRISPDGTRHTVLHKLTLADGAFPRGSLIQATNNALYGTTTYGGTTGNGTIFRIDTDGSNFRVLHNFTGTDGQSPMGSLLQASNGALYGMALAGGSLNNGVLFRINLDGSGFRVLRNFTAFYERYNYGSLMQGADGFLYGAANGGNSAEPGSVFKIRMDGTAYTTLYKFPVYKDGAPVSALVQGPDGTLYGTAIGDGTNTPSGFGNIFKINPDGTGYKIVHFFNGSNGATPRGDLTLRGNKLFGFTTHGGVDDSGVIFEFDLITASYKKRYDLVRATGINPMSGSMILVEAPDPEVNFVSQPANNTLYIPLTTKVTANLVAGAATYTIELNPDPSFGAATAIRSTGGRSQTFSNLAPGTIYYNRVKTNITPNWGPTRQFSTGDGFTLVFITSPANNTRNVSTSPNVVANTVPGATTYTIQLSTDPYFGSVIERTGSSTKLSFSGLEMDTKYYARVQTDRFPGRWGPLREFTTGNPLSLSYVTIPGPNVSGVSTIVMVTSNTVPDATSYTIQLSEDASFASIAFQSTGSSTTTRFSGLKYNTKYYNRVRTNLTTSFGQVRTFTTRTAESMAYVTSPVDNATNVKTTSLYIHANTVPGATRYTIQLSESSNFSSIAFQRTGSTRSLLFTGLKYNTRYYNRVLTNLTSVYGRVRSFTTMAGSATARIANADTDSGDEFTDMKINVYPNPFDDKFFYLIESLSDEASVTVVDMRGQIVHESLRNTNALHEVSDPLPAGVYLLKVKIGPARKIVKVVKMH